MNTAWNEEWVVGNFTVNQGNPAKTNQKALKGEDTEKGLALRVPGW